MKNLKLFLFPSTGLLVMVLEKMGCDLKFVTLILSKISDIFRASIGSISDFDIKAACLIFLQTGFVVFLAMFNNKKRNKLFRYTQKKVDNVIENFF